ncbi:MAG TPA: hypothetical protein VIT22_04565 [Pseudoxanthomonas sp.]
MSAIQPRPLPDGALLGRHRQEGAYTDCYATDLAGTVSHSRFVEAFYTTRVFKLERLILRLAVSRSSTDTQAAQLARGDIDSLAAWSVEARRENELLLCDLHGHTRSWLMSAPLDGGGTRLYFGSAIVPSRDPRTGVTRMGNGFRALLGFHKLYSRILLGAARARLESGAI